ncbi:MAG: hypothetical protein RI980_227, partial [Bacteroidota bacterium]
IEFNKEFKRIVASHTATFREEEEKNFKAASNESSNNNVASSSNNAEKSTLGDIDALMELKAKMEKSEKK